MDRGPCVQRLPKICDCRLVDVSAVGVDLDDHQHGKPISSTANMAHLEFRDVPVLDFWVWWVICP